MMAADLAVRIVDANDDEMSFDEEDALPPPLEYDDDDPNLVTTFKLSDEGIAALKKISEDVCDEFDKAWSATEEYRTRMAEDWKIFSGDLPKKPWPWENCANAHVPIMIENISRLTFRAYGEVFGNWDTVFNVLPVGPDDNLIADVMTKHDNWQLRNVITDFPRQMHRGFLAFFSIGDVTGHSYWSEERQSNRHEILLPDQFVTPFVYTTTQPDYSDVPFVVKIVHMGRHEIQAMRETWEDTDAVVRRQSPEYMGGTKGEGTRPSYDDEPEQVMSDVVAEVQGVEKTDDSSSAPYKLLWFEGWMELPNQDRDRYIQAIVDPHTKTLLKLSIHEQPDWQDQRRYERQMAERDQYLMALEQTQMMAMHLEQQHAATVGDLTQSADAVAAGVEDGSFGPLQAARMGEELDGMVPPPPEPPPPPPPPKWALEADTDEEGKPLPRPVKRVPIHLFSHAVCIEPLVGSLGLGYGRIEADFTRAANTALSQFTDAATQANVKSFLTTEGVKLPQDSPIAPGKFLAVTGAMPGELQGSIMPLEFGPANQQLLEVVKLMSESGQSAIQAPNVLSGEPGKSGETFRGQQGRMEAATKQLSVVTGKLVDWLKQIAKNNATLNAVHLEEDQIVEVTNHITRTAEQLQVSRRMWERNYMVEFRTDLRFTSSATRIQEADLMVQMAGHPALVGNFAFLHAAMKASLDARGKAEFLALLGKPPPPPQIFGVPTSPPAPPPGMAPPPGPGGPPPGGEGGGGGGGGGPKPMGPPSPGGQTMGPPGGGE